MPHFLIINPNSTQSVTDSLKENLDPVAPPGVTLSYFTAPPKAPAGCYNYHLSCLSAVYCFDELEACGAFDRYDGFLVCCCSDHPLQHMLREYIRCRGEGRPAFAMGMFEAAIGQALTLGKRFGIMTLESQTVTMLTKGVVSFLGAPASERFVDCLPIGVTLDELMEADRSVIKKAIKAQSGPLAARGAESIIMGCAGFAGMEDWYKEGAREAGVSDIHVIDGAKAGVEALFGLYRMHGSKKVNVASTNGHK